MRRYYEELWNQWDFDLAVVLLSPEIRFRGWLVIEVCGVEGFQGYMRTVQAAFPDFTNALDDLIVEGDSIAARLTYRGTHRGELLGIAPTGRAIEYSGAAFFKIAGGKIASGWVLGDTTGLKGQLRGDRLEIVTATLADREWAAEWMASTEPWARRGITPDVCRRACCDPEYLVFIARSGEERHGFIVLQARGV